MRTQPLSPLCRKSNDDFINAMCFVWAYFIFDIPEPTMKIISIISISYVACGYGDMTVNSPSGSTLQCDTLLWDDMPLNSPKRPPLLEFYIWFRFRPYHRAQHVIPHQSPKFHPNRTTLGRKNDVMSMFKMADLSHLGF